MSRITTQPSSVPWTRKNINQPVTMAKAPTMPHPLPSSLPPKIWTPSPIHGFIPGTITDLGSSTLTILATDPVTKKQVTMETNHFNVFPAEDGERDYEDNCGLMYLNEATLLENLRLRWVAGKIYTYTANMLIALNPYSLHPKLYSEETIKLYQGKSLGTLAPHVFAIADKSYRDMKTSRSSQSIIVSGESGAGKTESTKYVLKFLCSSAKGGGGAGGVEQRVLDANPLLESFGNAKTTRNNNSSRFGKFIEIHFDTEWRVAGGYISHYLLEKSRIPSQSPSERNYHIFYQLLSGLDTCTKASLGLHHPISSYNYLSSGVTEFFGEKLKDSLLNDKKDFGTLEKSFKNLNILNVAEVYKIVALVLHIGNLEFIEDEELTSKGGCKVLDNESLELVVKLAGLDKDEVMRALTNRVMQTAKGGVKGTVIQVPLKKWEALNARDALGKEIYNRLFDYLVGQINGAIPFEKGSTGKYIGVLDIAGFEYFTVNSFEQCMINFCNEKLQNFFNERVLRDEQELYARESLGVGKIEFIDNVDCIELIEGKPGLLSILDEEGKLPKPGYQHFTTTLHQTLGGHFRLELPRRSKIKEHREILDDAGFIIRHFAGAVCYETKSFLEKNNDALHFSLEILLQNSGNPFLKQIFSEISTYRGKLGFISVAGKFKTQLGELLDKLRTTGTSFVRCVKPNTKMVSGIWEGGLILSQLQAAGMTSVLELMQGGFPSRAHFAQLYATYSELLPPKLSKLDPRFFCRALFKAVGLSESDFKFGLTRVFFRPGKFKEFDIIMRSDGEGLRKMVEKVGKWIVLSRWKRGIYTVLGGIKLKNKILYRRSALIKIQKTVKMHLSRKIHRPRYLTCGRLTKLLARIDDCSVSVGKLKKGDSVKGEVLRVENLVKGVLREIKTTPTLQSTKLSQLESNATKATEELVKLVSKKIQEEKNQEEIERARKIQEEMEAARRAKEEEAERKREEEEARGRKHTLELRRRQEDMKLSQLESLATSSILQKPPPTQNESVQEQRDVEMALRLANMEGSTVDISDGLKRSDFVMRIKEKKIDLSGWKYSDLRDAINTSCDVELLGACREEFHRRLKVYHAWKAKNSSKTTPTTLKDSSIRAPQCVLDYQKSHAPTKVEAESSHRFFRVPIKGGLWYAHFFGEFIQRQMEVGGGAGKCFKSGTDDMQMCELKLSETGLSRRRGAEILDYEFEREWSKWQ